MKTIRVRQINILELDQALYNTTYNAGLEMSNCFNASIHVCVLESEENKTFNRNEWLGASSKTYVENLIKDVSENRELLTPGLSFDEYSENHPLREIYSGLPSSESLSILGYNKSVRHKEVLKRLLKEDVGFPLMLIPNGKHVKSFHKIIVPFEPEFVTKRKLLNLKWIADQLGVMIDFIHFKRETSSEELSAFEDIYKTIKNWVGDLNFCSKVTFQYKTTSSLNTGLKDYVKNQESYFICIIDREIKKSISTSFIPNEECLMDIKEPVVIL